MDDLRGIGRSREDGTLCNSVVDTRTDINVGSSPPELPPAGSPVPPPDAELSPGSPTLGQPDEQAEPLTIVSSSGITAPAVARETNDPWAVDLFNVFLPCCELSASRDESSSASPSSSRCSSLSSSVATMISKDDGTFSRSGFDSTQKLVVEGDDGVGEAAATAAAASTILLTDIYFSWPSPSVEDRDSSSTETISLGDALLLVFVTVSLLPVISSDEEERSPPPRALSRSMW
mmetsp:Transcript_34709/g.83869  ORF Transcript_34709/g.83869 Transcript_34709/m.83869 type:complete len:233 (-) Transcript_34709:805-1503(-)